MSQFNDYRVNEVPRLPEGAVVEKGTSATTGPASATIYATSAVVGTAGDTNEADLITYTVPANTLSADNKRVRLIAWGSFGNNGNNKTLKLYWNGTNIATIGPTASTNAWRVEIDVIRSSATNAKVKGCAMYGTTTATGGNLAVTSDFTTGMIIKVTGTNGTASANDVQMDFGYVEAGS